MAAGVVVQDIGLLPEIGDHDIDAAVVVDIAERRTATRPASLERGAASASEKLPFDIAQQQRRLLISQVRGCDLDVVHNVALRHEEVVVVVIGEIHSPYGQRIRSV